MMGTIIDCAWHAMLGCAAIALLLTLIGIMFLHGIFGKRIGPKVIAIAAFGIGLCSIAIGFCIGILTYIAFAGA